MDLRGVVRVAVQDRPVDGRLVVIDPAVLRVQQEAVVRRLHRVALQERRVVLVEGRRADAHRHVQALGIVRDGQRRQRVEVDAADEEAVDAAVLSGEAEFDLVAGRAVGVGRLAEDAAPEGREAAVLVGPRVGDAVDARRDERREADVRAVRELAPAGHVRGQQSALLADLLAADDQRLRRVEGDFDLTFGVDGPQGVHRHDGAGRVVPVLQPEPVVRVVQPRVGLDQVAVVAQRKREPALVEHLLLAFPVEVEEQDLPQAGVQAVLGERGDREVLRLPAVAALDDDVLAGDGELHLLAVPLAVGQRDPRESGVVAAPLRHAGRHAGDVDVGEGDGGDVVVAGERLEDEVEVGVVPLDEFQRAALILAVLGAAGGGVLGVLEGVVLRDGDGHRVGRGVAVGDRLLERRRPVEPRAGRGPAGRRRQQHAGGQPLQNASGAALRLRVLRRRVHRRPRREGGGAVGADRTGGATGGQDESAARRFR